MVVRLNSQCQYGGRGASLLNEHKDPELEPKKVLGDSKTEIDSRAGNFKMKQIFGGESAHEDLLSPRSKSSLCIHSMLRWILGHLNP